MTERSEEIHIHRVAAREASSRDWAALRRLAEADPGVWSRMASALEDQAALESAMAAELARSARLRLPQAADLGRRARLVPLRWMGWAAAVLLALLWAGERWADGWSARTPADGAQIAGWPGPVRTAQQALEAFRVLGRQDGRIVRELPVLLLNHIPSPDGTGQEVYYLRRVIERARVDDVFALTPDDGGSPMPVPLSPVSHRSTRSL